MILLSSTKLEAALAQGKLSDWGKTKYLLLAWAAAALCGPQVTSLVRPCFGPKAPLMDTWIALVGAVLSMWITIAGLKRCFEVNRGIDGDRFIERVTVLLVPITIRVLIVLVPLSVASWIVVARGEENSRLRRYFPGAMWLINLLVLTLYYWLLARSLRRLRSRMADGGAQSAAAPGASPL